MQHLLDLARVIRHDFRRRIDRRKAAADDAGRQPDLQVRERCILRRAGQLQRHEKVGCLADTADQVVPESDDRGLARAGRECNMIETELPGIVERETAAEADAAVGAKRALAQQREIDHLEEILVPAHRDPVFGNAAETVHRTGVEIFVQRLEITYRSRRLFLRTGQ